MPEAPRHRTTSCSGKPNSAAPPRTVSRGHDSRPPRPPPPPPRAAPASMARVLFSSRAGAAGLARRLGALRPGEIPARRHHHARRRAATLLEVEAAVPSTSAEGNAAERRIEEALDSAMARMAEPDWAVFRPGTSYYAPPRPAGLARGLLALLNTSGGMGPLLPVLSADEARAVASGSRGHPCSAYFIHDQSPDEVEGSRQDADPAEEK